MNKARTVTSWCTNQTNKSVVIVLPKWVRDEMKLKDNTEFFITHTKDSITLKKYNEPSTLQEDKQ